MKKLSAASISHFILFLCLFLLLMCPVVGQKVRIGIVTDFNKSPEIDTIFQQIVEEVDRVTGSSKVVSLSSDNIIYGSKTLDQAQVNFREISERIDFVLLIGAVSVKGAVLNASFSKPTIGLGVVDPYLQDLPIEDGQSQVHNFSYIWAAKDIRSELLAFKQLYPFESLAVLVDEGSARTFNQVKGVQLINVLEEELSTAITIVPVEEDVLVSIPEGTDAVYVSELFGKSPQEITSLASLLKDQGLASFSGSKWYVDNGMLASVANENDINQSIRRLAIMVDDALSGSQLSEMQVALNHKEAFFLNLNTAQEIDFSPPFEILFTANLISDPGDEVEVFSLEEIMEIALEESFDIQISYQDIELAEQDIRRARSSMLPSLDLGLSARQINSESASAAFGTPERQASGQLSLTQVIYSEEAIAGIKITQYLKKAQEFDTEADILGVLLDTYNGYFNVLASKTNLTIQQENLNNTKTNLELARDRVSVGSASNADVYRWESEVAVAKQAVVEAQTTLLTAKLQLNTFLANVLPDGFDIEDVAVDDETYQDFKSSPIAEFVITPQDLNLVSDFMVKEAQHYNPNKRFLQENINVIAREKLQNSRLFYVPQVAFQAQANEILSRGGQGSTELPGTEFINTTWQLGISLNYPIFRGFNRRANLQKSTVQLAQIDHSRRKLDQDLALAVRASVLSALGATTNITFSERASESARLNFGLIQDNYKQGAVSITQLIDAQAAALRARLGYALSIYEYIQAQLQLEFAVGFFSAFATDEQAADFEDRFNQFINEN